MANLSLQYCFLANLYPMLDPSYFLYGLFFRLPIPWFLGCLMAIPEPYVDVDAEGLLCSIILLFCMLIAVIGTVACFRWRLSKPLGATYMLLYFGFVTCSILLAYGIIPCVDISL